VAECWQGHSYLLGRKVIESFNVLESLAGIWLWPKRFTTAFIITMDLLVRHQFSCTNTLHSYGDIADNTDDFD